MTIIVIFFKIDVEAFRSFAKIREAGPMPRAKELV